MGKRSLNFYRNEHKDNHEVHQEDSLTLCPL